MIFPITRPSHPTTIALGLALGLGASSLLADQQPTRDPKAQPAAPARIAADKKVDLNTATREQLAAVDAIGPEVAARIVAARPFTSIHDLDRLDGLSAEQLEQIRARVTLTAPPLDRELGEPTGRPDRLGAPDYAEPDVKPTGRIDLNRAARETLAAVPAIGPDLAREIVAARPFESVDELSRVKGLSAERLEQIRSYVAVSPRAERNGHEKARKDTKSR